MRLIAIFEDTAAMTEVRARLDPEHIDYLRTHFAEIPIAGGLRNEPGGSYVGGLWVLEVSTRQRAVELIEGDPYFQAEPRPYRLLFWGKALPELRAVL